MNFYSSYHHYRQKILEYKKSKEEQTSPLTQFNFNSKGKIGWAVLWLLGIPIPVLIVLFLLRGCT